MTIGHPAHNVYFIYLDVHTLHCTYVDDMTIGHHAHNVYFTFLDVNTLHNVYM